MTALDTFIDKLPAIITALGAILAAYWAYKAQTQSKANSGAIAETKAAVEQQSLKQ